LIIKLTTDRDFNSFLDASGKILEKFQPKNKGILRLCLATYDNIYFNYFGGEFRNQPIGKKFIDAKRKLEADLVYLYNNEQKG